MKIISRDDINYLIFLMFILIISLMTTIDFSFDTVFAAKESSDTIITYTFNNNGIDNVIKLDISSTNNIESITLPNNQIINYTNTKTISLSYYIDDYGKYDFVVKDTNGVNEKNIYVNNNLVSVNTNVRNINISKSNYKEINSFTI